MGLFGRAFQSNRVSSPEPAESRPGSRRMNDRLRANLNLPIRSANKQQETPGLPSSTSPVSDKAPTALGRMASTASRNGVRNRQGSVGASGTARPGSNTAPWENSKLELHELADLYEEIDHCMSHCRYAIAGVGALIDAGFSGRTANKVTVVCPEECKDVIRGWAMTASGVGTGGAVGADSVSLRIRDGTLRRVRIRWLPGEDFERLDVARSTISQARVLGLASQLDQIATAWVRARAQPHADPAKQAREMAVIEGDLFWLLRRAFETNTHLDPAHLPLFLSEKFWTLFTRLHADARFQVQRAGVDVAAVLKGHRERDDLRAHEALLRQFGETMVDDGGSGGSGGSGGTGAGAGAGAAWAGEAPRGPFEGLRHLGSTIGSHAPARDGIASVYTVAMTDEARSEVGATPAGPEPQPQWPPSPGMLRRTREWLGRPTGDDEDGVSDGAGSRGIRRTPAPAPAPGPAAGLQRSLTVRKPPPPVRQFSVGLSSTEMSRRSVDMVMGRGTPQTWL